ncbi:COG3650 family protein [Hydrogenimonas sp.]
MRFFLFSLLIFSFLLADPKTYAYRCDDGFDFVVRFERSQTWLFGPDFSETLPFIEKGLKGEMRFKNGETLLVLQGGDRATLVRKGRVHACRIDRRRSVWEDAKFRGVDFRAVGNEPPWILEITGDRLDLYMGYDRRHYRFRAEPRADAKARRTRYFAQTNGHTLDLVLTPGPCADSMADETYETRVTLTFDGRTLHGCGQALH